MGVQGGYRGCDRTMVLRRVRSARTWARTREGFGVFLEEGAIVVVVLGVVNRLGVQELGDGVGCR